MPQSESEEQLQSSPTLCGETIALTGTLASMPHRQAMEIIELHGGQATHHVSRHTTILVVGEEGWPLEEDGRPSQKLEYALKLQSESVPIRILNETEWLFIVGLNEHREEVHRVYTPAMLSRLLDIPVESIRAWERAGLIRPVRKIYRLPYFDFQEVTSARKLNELVRAGVPVAEIQAGLNTLSSIFDDAHRALQQLTILTQSPHVVYRDESGPISPQTGQRLFDFDSLETADPEHDESSLQSVAFPSQTSSDGTLLRTGEQWLVEGCRLADLGETSEAIDALRRALSEIPGDPEANFHLANCLYRDGYSEAAIERLYATCLLYTSPSPRD